jgi:hypothetical protein
LPELTTWGKQGATVHRGGNRLAESAAGRVVVGQLVIQTDPLSALRIILVVVIVVMVVVMIVAIVTVVAIMVTV